IPGAYDPYASGAPVRIFATGVRNAYDLLWHSNGHLYVPTNGSAAGGNLPALPPLVPEVIRGGPTQDDFLFDVVAGGYYGHPNPRRAEYVLNGGNPTADADFAEVVTVGSNPGYPVGVQPAARYDRSRIAWNFGRNRSPNGIIEYTNATFGGRLSGSMLVMEYSGGDDILSFKLDPQGRVLPQSVVAVVRGLTDPLDLVEHQPTGALFVTDLSDEGRKEGRVLLLRPAPSTDPACQ
ncbi:MAG TPA: hypothetical protein VEY30_05065, partial [Myxococcaceae bacterium]|nr:hypothetical protein [Myxococcaceae bacterium]